MKSIVCSLFPKTQAGILKRIKDMPKLLRKLALTLLFYRHAFLLAMEQRTNWKPSYHHFSAIEHQLKPIAGYFQAHVVPSNVYAHNEHFSGATLHDQGILTRLQDLAESVVELDRRIGRGAAGASGPAIPRKSLL